MRKINIPQANDWFTITELSDGVFAISEEKHEQRVSSFLILGTEEAVLFDTGLGIFNIKDVVDAIYDGDLTVINSHFHFDHAGNNWRFPEVRAVSDAYSEHQAANGIAHEKIASQVLEKCFIAPTKSLAAGAASSVQTEEAESNIPEGFNPDDYFIHPYKINPLQDGETFDLGDRVLKVIYAPGHSQDGIVLYDETNGLLFTGDFFYMGGLFVFFNDEIYGVSNLEDYEKAARRIVKECAVINAIFPSHNSLTAPANKIEELVSAFEHLKSKPEPDVVIDDIDPYTGEKMRLERYNFDGFGIVLKA